MLRLLHRHLFTLSIASDRSCRPTLLRLIHGKLPKTPNSSFSDITISYLVGSCGLSPAAAISVAKNFTFKTNKTTTNADSFLSLLRSHGFTQSQIADIIIKFPSLLTYNPEKKIKPKLEFFLNLGYSRADLVRLITSDIHILKNSLEKRIKPNYDTLKAILGTDREIIVAIGNSSRILRQNLDRYLLPNIKTLRDLGVPGHRIVKLVTFYPRSLLINPAKFNKAVDLLKKMGFDVSKSVFTLGVNVLTVLCNSTWNRKFKLYRSLGWSDDDVLTAFKKHPFCMLMSEKKIWHNFNFFAKELEWTPSFVASRPVCLFFSFENTIFPRYKIFRLLESEGLLKINGSFSTLLWLPKKKFLNRYVIKFADQVPELLEVYKDNLALTGLRCSSRELGI
ncbi:uncharacterized protein LOC110031532 [Phalaenopsis equestris]|uniref:uncharacterized protein LOC110031532 n=1 Tax=Phalaenopsis equestris TaxID=78828 RepID=UPI0009E53AF8|nr:uncharacterized protein LOC110031532 [Phalaenopsis equestris]